MVLAELTLNRDAGDAATRAGIARYLDGYNGALRTLARTNPTRYFFLPAPDIYAGSVAWVDAAHETAEAPLAEYLAGGSPGTLDADGVALLAKARGNPCALLADARFGVERYSEGATLVAYLQDFRRSGAARRWLSSRQVPASARIALRGTAPACRTA